MPRIEYDTYKPIAKTNYDFPKLKLKVGEVARIALLETPSFEWTHRLQKHLLQDGKPVTFTGQRRNGSTFTDYEKKFLSSPICLGHIDVLNEQGADPGNCPICALAKEGDLAEAPKRRFAVNVIRYRTKPGGAQLMTPYSVDWMVWQFTEARFNKLVQFKNEWGDLRKHDLLLGPCEAPEQFQKYDIQITQKAEWMEDDERRKRTSATFNDNKMDDLAPACGSKKERRWIEQDIEEVREAWTQVQAAEGNAPTLPAAPQVPLTDQLSGLMDDLGATATNGATSTEEPGWTHASGGAAAGDDLDGLFASTPARTTAPEQESRPAAEQKSVSTGSTGDLDDLLADIDI